MVSRCTNSLMLLAPHTVPQVTAGGKSLRSERALRATSAVTAKLSVADVGILRRTQRRLGRVAGQIGKKGDKPVILHLPAVADDAQTDVP